MRPRRELGSRTAVGERDQLPSWLSPDLVVVELSSVADAGADLSDAVSSNLPTFVAYPNPPEGTQLYAGTRFILDQLAGRECVTVFGYDTADDVAQALERQIVSAQ